MPRKFIFWKVAAAAAISAMPLGVTGCSSTTGSSWAWNPWSRPTLSSWNWWKSPDTSVAQARPSNQVPTPNSQMMPGSRTNESGGSSAPTFAGNTPTARQGADYGVSKASATQPEGGYYTGPYSTGGAPNTQQGPYSNASAGASAYQNNTTTADRRSSSSYGAGSSGYAAPGGGQSGAQNYGAPPAGGYPSTGTSYGTGYGSGQANPYMSGSASGGATSAPNAGWNSGASAAPAAMSPSAGKVMAGNAGVAPSAPVVSPGSASVAAQGAYRPGSTGRAMGSAGDVQRASYDNTENVEPRSSESTNYPNTGAAAPNGGDFQGYR